MNRKSDYGVLLRNVAFLKEPAEGGATFMSPRLDTPVANKCCAW